MEQKADILLCSDAVFSAEPLVTAPKAGVVAIKGNKIVGVAPLKDKEKWIGENTKVYELGDQLVCPGFLDNHVFFTGYVWSHLGVDVSGASTGREVAELLAEHAKEVPAGKGAFGYGMKPELLEENMDFSYFDILKGHPAVVFTGGRDGCLMNEEAKKVYGFDEETVYAEACYRVFNEYLQEEEFIKREYEEFSNLLASRGVTAIKEIGFDRYSGFTKHLKEMEEKKELKHRVNLVSQPVGTKMDLEYAKECQEKFQGEFVQFMGFNVMVDGEIRTGYADMLEEYKNRPGIHCLQDIDYEALEKDVLEADKRNIRCALHAEGDRAVRKVIDIYEKCRQMNGERDARHTIIDLEMTHPDDLKRMEELGITAINYVQIIDCLGEYEDFYGYDCVGEEGIKNYWAYKRMIDAGVTICCGTDMPLTIPNIPLSVYLTVTRQFPGGKPEEGINKDCALAVNEIVRAWTLGGQYANFKEKELGTLEEGKLADIAVIDRNLFAVDIEEAKKARVSLTICDGKVVFELEARKSSLEME